MCGALHYAGRLDNLVLCLTSLQHGLEAVQLEHGDRPVWQLSFTIISMEPADMNEHDNLNNSSLYHIALHTWQSQTYGFKIKNYGFIIQSSWLYN